MQKIINNKISIIPKISKNIRNFSNNDILLFKKPPYYCNNNIANEKREDILSKILFIDEKDTLFENDDWYNLKEKFKNVVENICNKKYDYYIINRKGGFHNWDFDLLFYKNNNKIQYNKLEFKNGSDKLSNLPCFLTLAVSEKYKKLLNNEDSYTNFYYNKFLPKINNIYNDMFLTEKYLNIEDYIRKVVRINSRHKVPYFKKLFEDDVLLQQNNNLLFNEKKEIVNHSIKDYFRKNNYSKNINKDFINEKLYNSQGEKIFIMWKNDNFNIEQFDYNDLHLSGRLDIEDNKIIFDTLNNNKIIFKLIWNRRQGILMPSWKLLFSQH